MNAPRYVALCQDCNAPHMFDTEALQLRAHRGEIACGDCMGDLCACASCVADAPLQALAPRSGLLGEGESL